jgi:hypothetical protein
MVKRGEIFEAIEALHKPGSRKGVSRCAIRNYVGIDKCKNLNYSLKVAVARGDLIQVKDSFKLVKKEKKTKTKSKSKPKRLSKCNSNQIRNPATKRCVKKDGKIGKTLV